MLILDAPHCAIVVQEAHGRQAQPGVARQFADDEAAPLPAADDEHLARALAGADGADAALDDELHREAGTDEQGEREQEEGGNDAGRERNRSRRTWEGAGRMNAVLDPLGTRIVVGHCRGCSSAMIPTTTTVATNTPLITAS